MNKELFVHFGWKIVNTAMSDDLSTRVDPFWGTLNHDLWLSNVSSG